MSAKHYKKDYFEGGKPVHKLSYCAFLDILGFSARIEESYKSGAANNLLQEFHEIFAKCLSKIKLEADENYLYFKSFSDNVLLAHPSFSDDMESEFGFILWSISEYQFQMALNGFFIRGGLSVGPLFIDDNNVYGSALLKAYELETKAAINPIVVLCDKTMLLVDKHITYYMGESAPQIDHIFVNADGRYFINYLRESILEADYDLVLDTNALAKHREEVEKALKQYKSQPAVFAKFSWLAEYHNYFCDSVSSFDGYTDNLKVDFHLASVKFQRLKKKKK